MKKFLVVLNTGLKPTQDVITAHFRGKNWPLWHWFENLWLLADVPDEMTPRLISEELYAIIRPLAPGGLVSHMVMEIDDSPLFFGRGPKEGWDWMQLNWGKADAGSATVSPATTDSSQKS